MKKTLRTGYGNVLVVSGKHGGGATQAVPTSPSAMLSIVAVKDHTCNLPTYLPAAMHATARKERAPRASVIDEVHTIDEVVYTPNDT